ncbi:ABC transporter [Sinosporangium siamense]|uniref:ABC transporter n=2 Tax=Sinosporangium siamense TaxID=1367973 RepID=A0A919RJ20_9ACTN|nr:ABC transporter [Sinosporangium siamense]
MIPRRSPIRPATRDGATLTCAGVSVDFGGFRALSDVTATFPAGQVHAVVGQNGAGKTTLSRVMAGLVTPAAGTVQVGDRLLPGGNVSEARRNGVELVHQHFALPPDFTVAECFELFNGEQGTVGAFSRAGLTRRAADLLAGAGAEVAPDAVIGRLPVETLQAVEIARALASCPKVLILDEPTAVLPPPAMRGLFDRLRRLAADGMCVIVVLHKMREVFGVADTACALRAGRLVLEPTPIGELDPATLSRAVVGDVTVEAAGTTPEPATSAPVELEVRELGARSGAHDASAADVSLRIRQGEIVGVAGVEGNGQRSLVEAIVGVTGVRSGSIAIGGTDVSAAPVRERRARGLRVIPFERNVEGVSLSSALWENHAAMDGGRGAFLITPQALKRRCQEALRRWKVSYRSVDQQTGNLSGGNVQKTILAREITDGLRVLVAAHPTRGLDIAAASDVRGALVRAAEAGAAVLVVSADLEEMFEVCHRVLVMLGGRVVATFERPFDAEPVGAAMVGGGGG